MSNLNNPVNRWNELIGLPWSDLIDLKISCLENLRNRRHVFQKTSDDSFYIGDNLILESSQFPMNEPNRMLGRLILILRPDLMYKNEAQPSGELTVVDSEILSINGVKLSGNAIDVANRAESKGYSIKKSTLTDIHGNRTLLLELADCGLEFRSKEPAGAVQESQLCLIYFMYHEHQTDGSCYQLARN